MPKPVRERRNLDKVHSVKRVPDSERREVQMQGGRLPRIVRVHKDGTIMLDRNGNPVPERRAIKPRAGSSNSFANGETVVRRAKFLFENLGPEHEGKLKNARKKRINKNTFNPPEPSRK